MSRKIDCHIMRRMITNAAMVDLGQAEGVTAYAIVKASDVMVALDVRPSDLV